jgi:hypothetical protein
MAAWNLGRHRPGAGTLDRCAREAMELGDAPLEIRRALPWAWCLGDTGRYDAAGREFRQAAARPERGRTLTGPARIVANLANLQRKQAAAHFAGGSRRWACAPPRTPRAWRRRLRRMASTEGNVAVEIDALAIRGCAHLRGEDSPRPASCCAPRWRWARLALPVGDRLGAVRGGRSPSRPATLEEARARPYTDALDVARELRPTRKIAVACTGSGTWRPQMGDVACATQWRERAAEETAAFEIASLQTRSQIAVFARSGWHARAGIMGRHEQSWRPAAHRANPRVPFHRQRMGSSAGGRTLPVVDPATGEVFAEIARGGARTSMRR